MKRSKKKSRWMGMIVLAVWILLIGQGDRVFAYFTASDTAVRYFMRDASPPILTVITPAGMTPEDPTYAVSPVYAVTGTVSDDIAVREVTVNGNKAVLHSGGCWSLDITLPDQVTQKVEVIAVDMAGNTMSEIRYVRYDSGIRFEDFTVTRYNRSMIGYSSETTDLVIPETFYDEDSRTWYHVVAIGFKAGTNTSSMYAAFSKNTTLTSVTIPGSVKTIARYAFYEDTAITSLTLGYGVEYLDMSAFSHCGSLTEVVMPDSITATDASVFSYDSGLQRAIISEGLTKIQPGLFSMCTGLAGQVVIPDSVTTIESNAFLCSAITSIVIPEGVTSIDDNAFRSCDQLTQVYYKGTQEQWAQIWIGTYNTSLTDAEIIYSYGAE